MKYYSLSIKSRALFALFDLYILWGYSSVGRAPALQAGGQEFDSPYLHHVSVKYIHVYHEP